MRAAGVGVDKSRRGRGGAGHGNAQLAEHVHAFVVSGSRTAHKIEIVR